MYRRELERASFDGVTLELFERGGWTPALRANVKDLPNLMSLFALLERHGHPVG